MTVEPLRERDAPSSFPKRMRALARGLRRDRRGNVLMIFGLAIVPLTVATGMGIDYGRAMRLQTKLNAAADAAALSAVSQYMMNFPSGTAQIAATNMFNTQSSGLQGLSINTADTSQLKVTVTDSGGATISRVATVTYKGQSLNSFSGVLGLASLTISGTSSTKATQAPDIDFYVMMDTSPSMALPSTTAGLSQMTSLTGGCAFACHATTGASMKTKTGTNSDYYGAAQSYGIPLRVDQMKLGVQNLADTATSTAQNNGAAYRMAISTFDATGDYQKLQTLTASLSTAKTKAGTAQLLNVYGQNYITQSTFNNDQDTDFTDLFKNANTQIPNPGNGTGVGSDTPQAVMFIVTDGMRDENASGTRMLGPVPSTLCTTIKNRGIRIAILDTDYLAQSLSDSWSQTNVAPILPQVDPAAQACASPGLYYKVTTDDDISAALSQLFQKTVETARITQ